MIKRITKKRIIIASIALLVLLITYMFPTKYSSNNIEQRLSYVEPNKSTIYLIDSNQMVSRCQAIIDTDNKDIIKSAKKVISALTIGSKESNYIPSGFKSIIPKNTKIKSIDLKDKILKINFDESILNIDKDKEEALIESLIYSLTEINGIDKIMIFVNDSLLTKLPKSNINLPNTLDRSYGINKIYDINDFKNTTKTTIYYLSEYNDYKYYTPVTYIDNNEKDKVEIIIEKLKSSPINSTNLMSYLQSTAQLLDYEITEKAVNLTFNNYIFNEFNDKNILEEVKYTIGLSIRDNYNIDNVVFNVNNEKIDEFTINGLE